MQSAGGRRWTLRLQPGQAVGLRSGGDRLDRDAGRLAPGLRGDGGKHSDKTTLRDFIKRIETQYGKARRPWVMDRGIPTEKVLAEMRASETPIQYLVGTPRGRLGQLEQDFLTKPWAHVRDAVQVKLVEQDGELYILARSGARRDKEQAMRRRRLKKLIKRLHELRQQKLTRDQLLIELGAARKEAGPAAWRIIDIRLPDQDQAVTPETFCFKLNWQKLREARRREGSYLLRSNVTGGDPAQLRGFYLQLVEVGQAFKELKGDLAIRPNTTRPMSGSKPTSLSRSLPTACRSP